MTPAAVAALRMHESIRLRTRTTSSIDPHPICLESVSVGVTSEQSSDQPVLGTSMA
jgi:hypothetical protein